MLVTQYMTLPTFFFFTTYFDAEALTLYDMLQRFIIEWDHNNLKISTLSVLSGLRAARTATIIEPSEQRLQDISIAKN